MISYLGIAYKNKISYLIFANNSGGTIEVPVDDVTADRVSKYLARIVEVDPPPPIRGNDEAAD